LSSNKKDLTRIEDLGEYLHALEEEEPSFEPTPDLPEIPTEETDFGSTDFGSETETENTDTTFTTSDEPDFGSSETSSFETPEEDNLFGAGTEETTDFGSTDFGSDFGSSEEAPLNSDDPFASEPVVTEAEPDISSFDTGFESTPEPAPTAAFEPEAETEFISEPEYVAPVMSKAQEQAYKAPENFEDLKKFAESSSFSGMGAEGNPSFSVLLKNVRYIEDVNDILSLMKELNLLSDSEEQLKARLMRGHLLVPRISEFAAIFLAHKLRRFDIDIQVGLSDEIHPPKHQESPETGLVSKHSLYQNQNHHFHFDDPKLEISQIIIAATPNLEGHQVIRYLGVASEHKMLEGHVVEDEGSAEIPRYYSELAQKLKAHALKANANAVIGLNYQLTPLPSEYGMSGSKYRLSCTGNLVWVNKL
jgi:uncharacterized protein YbjQ (UPF0145 family)